MDGRLDFRFELPSRPAGPLVAFSPEEMEKIMLKKLEEAREDSTQAQALWELAQFYKLTRQHEKALERLRQLIERLPDPEDKANCIFTIGQAMEQVGDYPAAIRYYREAFALEPARTFTWYFIHNNLGFSLNTLGRFDEGESYCRRAIEIDPQRPNAFKNLGIAQAGQGRYAEAAQAFVAATQANASDARAFHLLEDLLKQHPELEYDFHEKLELCREAVAFAARQAGARKPVVHRGWRKRLILLGAKLRSILRRWRGAGP